MKTDVNINLSKLPANVVDAAIEASGATTPRALVLAGLKALAERDEKPVATLRNRRETRAFLKQFVHK